MNWFQALILGLVQGATEFVPVSSSAHLTLIPWLLNWQFDAIFKGAFDVMTHWGTMIAVLIVFWRDLWALFLGGLRTLGGLTQGGVSGVVRRIQQDEQGRLAWWIVIGSIPAAVLGFALEDWFEMLFGKPQWVSLFLLFTAAMLVFAEWKGEQGHELGRLTWLDALWIGVGQAVAIAPGISRSGATMAVGLLRGVRREAAARFSFWLSAPVIIGAGVWQIKDLFEIEGWAAWGWPLLVGLVSSATMGYLCIRFLLGYLRRGRLYPFAIYCALAGLSCLIFSWVR